MLIYNQFLTNMLNFLIMIMLISLLTIPIFIKFNPLILSIIFIFYVMIMSLFMCIMQMSNLFSFILFMSMISGLMVVFMYFSSLSNSKKINLNFKKKKILIMIYILIMIFFMIFNKINMDMMMNFDMKSIFMNMKEIYPIKQMYFYPEMKMMMFMISYLLISLMCIIKICNMKSSPLRKFK